METDSAVARPSFGEYRARAPFLEVARRGEKFHKRYVGQDGRTRSFRLAKVSNAAADKSGWCVAQLLHSFRSDP
ncbi:unnamed protein product, partial [Iphiclides podalirius]